MLPTEHILVKLEGKQTAANPAWLRLHTHGWTGFEMWHFYFCLAREDNCGLTAHTDWKARLFVFSDVFNMF